MISFGCKQSLEASRANEGRHVWNTNSSGCARQHREFRQTAASGQGVKRNGVVGFGGSKLRPAIDGVVAARRMIWRMMEVMMMMMMLVVSVVMMMIMVVMMMTKHCLRLSHPTKVCPRVLAKTKNIQLWYRDIALHRYQY